MYKLITSRGMMGLNPNCAAGLSKWPQRPVSGQTITIMRSFILSRYVLSHTTINTENYDTPKVSRLFCGPQKSFLMVSMTGGPKHVIFTPFD